MCVSAEVAPNGVTLESDAGAATGREEELLPCANVSAATGA